LHTDIKNDYFDWITKQNWKAEMYFTSRITREVLNSEYLKIMYKADRHLVLNSYYYYYFLNEGVEGCVYL